MSWFKKMFGKSVAAEPKDYDNLINSTSTVYKKVVTPKPNGPCINPNSVEPMPDDVEKVIEIKAPDFVNVAENKIKPLDLMKVSFKDSPNKSKRGTGERPLYIVLHHTGPGSFNGIVNWLCNKDAKASAHYVLGTGGQLKQLINTKKYESWHAGIARWKGEQINNHKSIGIEICNYGRMEKGETGEFYYEVGRNLKKYIGKIKPIYGSITYTDGRVLEGYYVPYPEKQLNRLVSLCKGLVKKYPQIKVENIIAHYQISPGRKVDPFGLNLEYIKNRIFDKGES